MIAAPRQKRDRGIQKRWTRPKPTVPASGGPQGMLGLACVMPRLPTVRCQTGDGRLCHEHRLRIIGHSSFRQPKKGVLDFDGSHIIVSLGEWDNSFSLQRCEHLGREET